MSTFKTQISSKTITSRIEVPEKYQTTNGTTQTAFSIPFSTNKAVAIKVIAVAYRTDFSSAQTLESVGCFRRAGGNIIRSSGNSGILKPLLQTIGDFPASLLSPTPTMELKANTSTQSIDVTVTGVNGQTIDWALKIETLGNI